MVTEDKFTHHISNARRHLQEVRNLYAKDSYERSALTSVIERINEIVLTHNIIGSLPSDDGHSVAY